MPPQDEQPRRARPPGRSRSTAARLSSQKGAHPMNPHTPLQARRRWRGAVLAVTGALVATAAVAIPNTFAHAVTIDPNAWYQIVSRHSGKAINICSASTADGACVEQRTRNTQTSQQFQFVSSGGGYYRL